MSKLRKLLLNNLDLVILSAPIMFFLYFKFGNPSEAFFETVETIAHFIFSIFLIAVVTVIAMGFYVSPEESKRRRECKCCCKCCCCKGEKQ